MDFEEERVDRSANKGSSCGEEVAIIAESN